MIEYKDRSWLILQCLKDFGDQPRDQLTSGGTNEDARQALTGLLRVGYVKYLNDNVVTITLSGLRKLRNIANAMSPLAPAGKRMIATGTVRGDYEPKELRRTCLRPGAYDAFELPSLIAGQRTYRREIKA